MLGLKTTFHRAFDQVTDPLLSLEEIISLGFNRILTSGQKNTAFEGISLIKELVSRSKGRIEIMAGSGVDHTNIVQLKNANINATHFSIHHKDKSKHSSCSIDEKKISNIMSSLGRI